jgi:holo-[acyl-carrier protein] synthase
VSVIYGIGTDILQISRVKAALGRHGDRFAEKILGPEEMLKYLSRKAKVEARGISYLATRFAAKEAFSKAIGLGMSMPMTWRAMQTLNAASGKPEVVCSGQLKTWMEENGLTAQVSITDEAEYAVAFVIAEKT